MTETLCLAGNHACQESFGWFNHLRNIRKLALHLRDFFRVGDLLPTTRGDLDIKGWWYDSIWFLFMLSFLISMNGLGVLLNCFDLKVFPKSSDVTLKKMIPKTSFCLQVVCMFHPVPFDKFPGYSWKARWVMSLVWLGCINSLGIHMLPEPLKPQNMADQNHIIPSWWKSFLWRPFSLLFFDMLSFSRCLVSVQLRPFQVFLIRSWDSFSIWHLLPEVLKQAHLQGAPDAVLNHWNILFARWQKIAEFCDLVLGTKKRGVLGKLPRWRFFLPQRERSIGFCVKCFPSTSWGAMSTRTASKGFGRNGEQSMLLKL